MALRRKIGLIIVLAMSLFTMSISIIKTIAAQGSTHASSHVEYDGTLGVLWSVLEQTSVIIMGCIPTLRGITKLEITTLNSLGSSLSTLIKRNRRQGSSLDDGYSSTPSKGYENLKMDTRKLGQLGKGGSAQGFTATSTYYPEGNIESKKSLVSQSHIRRDDGFSVSYDQRKETVVESV